MPRPRFDNLEPERREAILDAATRELAARGPEQASLNKILAEAGLSKGVAYYYFDDRADLFATVVARVIDVAVRSVGGVGPIRTADDFWREFRALDERVLRFLRAHPTAAALARRLAASPAALEAPRTRESYAAFRRWFGDFLRRGQNVGAVRTDLPFDLLVGLAFAWGETLDRWTLAHWDEVASSEASLAAHIEAGIGLFRRSFGAEAASSRDPARSALQPKTPKKKP